MTATTPENLFKHRWNTEKDGNLLGVVDVLTGLAERAITTLMMLSCQFQGTVYQLNDELTAGVIYTALAEIEDIRATVIDCHNSTKKADAA